ncbi:MAG: N-acetylmuramoyl-L-alanine amidase [Planctomycetes bacterium]|nr:N-acetylmuramoyl-L-alanine amidase [Planctomycetota bacterium]
MRIPLATFSLLIAASCAAPVTHKSPPVGLAPPVLSPAAGLSLQQKIDHWSKKIPAMSAEDRAEAFLIIGELQLENQQPDVARVSFYQALGGHLSASEIARSEKGIGLSYFLTAQPSLGIKHLQLSVNNLDAVSKAEASYLMSAYQGNPTTVSNPAVAKRMSIYLESASLKSPRHTAGNYGSGIHVDMTRDDWRASRIRSNRDAMTAPFRITVHHTAEPFYSNSAAASGAEVKNIQDQHMNERSPGWADIGYHFLIDRAGNVIAGRSLDYQGAHASGSNNIGNIGICLLGNFVSQPSRGKDYIAAQAPSGSQLSALTELVDSLRSNYSIKSSNVYGHKELKSTECPGPALSGWVATYRRNN